MITSSPPAWTSSDGMLSTPADSGGMQPPLLYEGWGGCPLCLSGDSSVLMDLLWSCECTAQCSVHRFSISRSSVRHFPEQSWTVVAFPCFCGQVFHELVCLLTAVLPQIFFNLTTLFSYPVFVCLFHASLDVVVPFPVFLRSFRCKSFRFAISYKPVTYV